MRIPTRPHSVTSTYSESPGVLCSILIHSLFLGPFMGSLVRPAERLVSPSVRSFTQVGGQKADRRRCPSLHRGCSELCGLNSLMMNGREQTTTPMAAAASNGRMSWDCTLSIEGEEVTTRGKYSRGGSQRPFFLQTGDIQGKSVKKIDRTRAAIPRHADR